MTRYVSNRNSDGKTDENGHFRLPLKLVEGEILEGLEVSATLTPSMSVNVSAGEAKIPYLDYAYAVWSDAGELVVIPTASSTGNRIDRLVAYVDRDMTFTSSDVNHPGALKYMVVQGTPATSPVPATDNTVQSAIGAGNPWIELGQVRVNRNVTQIVNADISSEGRVPVTMSSNVKLPEITTINGDSIKFAIINEGDPLPSAIEGSTLVVLVVRN